MFPAFAGATGGLVREARAQKTSVFALGSVRSQPGSAVLFLSRLSPSRPPLGGTPVLLSSPRPPRRRLPHEPRRPVSRAGRPARPERRQRGRADRREPAA